MRQIMMNKSLRAGGPESSYKSFYGFQGPREGPRALQIEANGRGATGQVLKKEPPFPAAFEVDNREASNRVDRSHSVSKEDGSSHT
jgi:hypothetical protein